MKTSRRHEVDRRVHTSPPHEAVPFRRCSKAWRYVGRLGIGFSYRTLEELNTGA